MTFTDWTPIIPIFITQFVWVTVSIVVVTWITHTLLRKESERMITLLAPFLKRVEHLGYISSEQAALNATTLDKVISKQDDVSVQVDGVPKTTADMVADKLPVVLKSTPTN